jgi:hypothetical protein
MPDSILAGLSSQVGDRTQQSTLRVAERCVREPAFLKEIAGSLTQKDGALAADCAEVFTQVAMRESGLVAPYAEALAAQLGHKTTRVRWECAHALSLVAATPPAVALVGTLLPRFATLLGDDKSIIVRDYAVSTFATYASAGPDEARAAFPHLVTALDAWDGRHAARALEGLRQALAHAPELRAACFEAAQRFVDHGKASIRQAAKGLARASG